MGDPGVDGRIILNWIFTKCDGRGMEWIDLAQYSGKWWAVVNTLRTGDADFRLYITTVQDG